MGLAVVLALVLPATHARAQVAQIVGGTPPTQAWPAQGYLEVVQNDGTTKTCAGTLVSGRWFLTAGHCASQSATNIQLPKTAFTVNLGESDITQFSGPERFAVDNVVRDPDFARVGMIARHDLALLHLATAPPADPRFEPLRVVTADEPGLWAPGVVATVIGWGLTTPAGTRSTLLQQAGVPILADDTCAADYPADTTIAFEISSMFCAGDGTADTCTGDSGGPIMVPRVDTFALAGVTSYGIGCGDPAHPGVYARVGDAAINAWVRSHIPTASISFVPEHPNPGDFISLAASATKPADQPGAATFRWDLDNDGRFDDALGAAIMFRVREGSNVVRVEESYPDGDRAIAREVVTTAGSPLPLAPPPPPPPPKPAPPPDPPAPPAATDPVTPTVSSSIPDTELARLLPGPHTLRLRGLTDGRMSVGVHCSVACRLSARLTLDARTAKRLGLSRSNTRALVGTGAARVPAGTDVKLVVKLTSKAVRALHGAAGGAMKLRVTARAGTRVQQLERTFKLRR